VHSDLLAIYLGTRLGMPCTITNMYTGKAYPVDKATGLPFCPRPGKKAGTSDDIHLP
jgi:hypothetical protein